MKIKLAVGLLVCLAAGCSSSTTTGDGTSTDGGSKTDGSTAKTDGGGTDSGVVGEGGGGDGGNDAGDAMACANCTKLVTDTAGGAAPCAGSEALFDAIGVCTCLNCSTAGTDGGVAHCDNVCATPPTGDATAECTACAQAACAAEVAACLADPSTSL